MPKCLICKSEYQPFVDFGEMPIANAFATKEQMENEYTFVNLFLVNLSVAKH